jgi:hypothetical protein
MPTVPSVFRSIRKNDVHQRIFKAYKNYIVKNSDYQADKYVIQKGTHKKYPANVGDDTYNYPKNATDGTNQHVVWNWIDHRYYRFPYDQTRCHELTNVMNVEKRYFISSSVLTVPYHEMGERIKPTTFTLITRIKNSDSNNRIENFNLTLNDDSYGNLRDIQINTGSFVTSSRERFYLSFNNEFRRFDDNFGWIYDTRSIDYMLAKRPKTGVISNVRIDRGVTMNISGSQYKASGLSGYFTSSLNSHVLIRNNNVFENFQRCDNWLISFWINPENINSTGSIISKYSRIKEQYYDNNDKLIKIRDVDRRIPRPAGDFTRSRTPFNISFINNKIHFQSSNGLTQLHLSASAIYRNNWMHVAIANSASLCKIYINGSQSGTTGKIPTDGVANNADVLIGTDTLSTITNQNGFTGNIAEVRIYDYEVSQKAIKSLANQNFYTGSLYQTNVCGNVFYRNGQVVISSPMPKYHDAFFTSSFVQPNEFTASYKGQHTVYENEVLVRVPMGACNISVNPSAVYRPATGIQNDCNSDGGGAEQYNRPGDFRKSMFISGTAKPYVTTIGLYNDQAQLLAVAKMAEPIQKRDDIDINFIVRWDY